MAKKPKAKASAQDAKQTKPKATPANAPHVHDLPGVLGDVVNYHTKSDK